MLDRNPSINIKTYLSPDGQQNRMIIEQMKREAQNQLGTLNLKVDDSALMKALQNSTLSVNKLRDGFLDVYATIQLEGGKTIQLMSQFDTVANKIVENSVKVSKNVDFQKIRKEIISLTKEFEKLETKKIKIQFDVDNESKNEALKIIKEEQLRIDSRYKQLISSLVRSGSLNVDDTINTSTDRAMENIKKVEDINRKQIESSQASKTIKQDELKTTKELTKLYQEKYKYDLQSLKLQQKLNSAATNTPETQEAYNYAKNTSASLQKKINDVMLENQTPQIQNVNNELIQKYNSRLQLQEKIIKANQSVNKSFFRDIMNGWKEAAARIVNYTVVYRSLWTGIQMFHDAVDTIEELNKAFTDIRMVTGYTADEVANLASQYSELAKDMGSTTKQIAEGATEWLRQGKTIEETNELLRQSTILSKVGAVESAQATEYLTSTLNGYKLEVEDAKMIVDAFSEVDQAAATSTAELAEAFSRTANIANNAGVSFNKLTGMIATVSEVTRKSASTIGESYKTIFSRLTNVAAGKVIDDEGESINDVEKTLNRFGIVTRNTADEWRNMEDVIDEIGSKWNVFSSVEKSQIATAIAGVRQQENFLALMNNYDRVLKYTEIAANSAGASAEKFDVYLESIDAKTNTLKATFEQIAYQPEFENLYKLILDIGIAFGELANNVFDSKLALASIGSLGLTAIASKVAPTAKNMATSLMYRGEALTLLSDLASVNPDSKAHITSSLFKNKTDKFGRISRENFARELLSRARDDDERNLFIKELKSKIGNDTLRNVLEGEGFKSEEIDELFNSFETGSKNVDKASFSFKNLKSTAKGAFEALAKNPFVWVAAAIAAIYALKEIYSNLTLISEKHTEKVQLLSEEYANAKSDLESLNAELSTTESRIEELSNKEAITFTEKKELENLQKANALLKEQIILEEEKANLKKDELVSESRTGLTNAMEDISDKAYSNRWDTNIGTFEYLTLDEALKYYSDSYLQAQKDIASKTSLLNDETITDKEKKEIEKELEVLKKAEEDAYNSALRIRSSLQEMYSGISLSDNIEDIKLYRESLEQTITSVWNMGGDITALIEQYELVMFKSKNEIEESLKESMGNLDTYLDTIISQFGDSMSDDLTNFISIIQDINGSFADGKIDINSYFDTLNKAIENVDWSNIDNDSALQATFEGIANSASTAFLNLSTEMSNNQIGVSDYFDKYKSGFESIANLSEKLGINIGSGFEEAISSMDSINPVVNAITKNIGYLSDKTDEFHNFNLENVDNTKSGYQDLARDMGTALSGLAETNAAQFNNIMSKVAGVSNKTISQIGATSDQITAHLLESPEAMEVALNETANETGNAISKMLNYASNMLMDLGRAVSNFEVDLNFSPEIIENKSIPIKLGNQTILEIPAFSYNIGGSTNSGSYDAIDAFKYASSISAPGTSGYNDAFKNYIDAHNEGGYLGTSSLYLAELAKDPNINHFDFWGNAGSGDSVLGTTGDSGDGDYVDELMDKYKSLKNAIEDCIAISEILTDNYETGTKLWNKELDKQIGYYEDLKELTQDHLDTLLNMPDGVKLYSEEISELRKNLHEFDKDIREINLTRINESADHWIAELEYQKSLTDIEMDSVTEGNKDWFDKIKEQISLNESLIGIEKERAEQLRELDTELYVEDIIKAELKIAEIRKENVELLEKQKDLYESIPDLVGDYLEKEKKEPLEKQKDFLKGLKDLNDTEYNLKIDFNDANNANNTELANVYQEQLNYISQVKNELDDINDADEKNAKLKEAQVQLQKMNVDALKAELELLKGERNKRIYYEDKGWVWEADQNNILQKEKEISDAQLDAAIGDIDNQIETIDDYIEKFEEIPEKVKAAKDKEVLNFVLGNNAMDKLYDLSLSSLNTYTKKYGSLIDELIKKQEELAEIQNMAYTAEGNKNYNGINYDPNVDYTQKQLDYIADGGIKGDTHWQELEAKKQAKIAGENLNPDGTKKTTGSSSSSKKTSSKLKEGTPGTATYHGITVPVEIVNGKTQTSLPSGAIVTTASGSQYQITGGSAGNYESIKVKHDGIESGLIGDVPIDSKKEVFIKALKGEGIFTSQQMNKGADLFNRLLLTSYGKYDTQKISTDNSENLSVRIGTMQVYSNDANDFMKQMRNIVAVTGNQ